MHAYDLIGTNVLLGKRVPLFCPADRPSNFVAAMGVAAVARRALNDSRLVRQMVTVGDYEPPPATRSRSFVAGGG